jgi:Rap1a immunity proteins
MATTLAPLVLAGAPAPQMTGNDLYTYCFERDDNLSQAYCRGLIHGIISGWLDAMDLTEDFSSQPTIPDILFRYCQPLDATMDDAIAIIREYLEDHHPYPRDLDRRAGTVVIVALSHAWPCR